MPHWRATLDIFCNLVDSPIAADLLPDEKPFLYFRRPLQTSSIPIDLAAFDAILEMSGLEIEELNARRVAMQPTGTAALERLAKGRTPKERERISKVIERGPEGERVKRARDYLCQICVALDLSPFVFTKLNGQKYAEAHHVQPVSELAAGSLGEHNIMVLCPNHHRQVHYGDLQIISSAIDHWMIRIDGSKSIRIDRWSPHTRGSH